MVPDLTIVIPCKNEEKYINIGNIILCDEQK